MKNIALALLCLLAPMTALGGEPTPAPDIEQSQFLFKPSIAELSIAFYKSGLFRVSTSVAIAYDEKGNVVAVKLKKATGSSSLDEAIESWAAKIKLKTTVSGVGTIPIMFAPY